MATLKRSKSWFSEDFKDEIRESLKAIHYSKKNDCFVVSKDEIPIENVEKYLKWLKALGFTSKRSLWCTVLCCSFWSLFLWSNNLSPIWISFLAPTALLFLKMVFLVGRRRLAPNFTIANEKWRAHIIEYQQLYYLYKNGQIAYYGTVTGDFRYRPFNEHNDTERARWWVLKSLAFGEVISEEDYERGTEIRLNSLSNYRADEMFLYSQISSYRDEGDLHPIEKATVEDSTKDTFFKKEPQSNAVVDRRTILGVSRARVMAGLRQPRK